MLIFRICIVQALSSGTRAALRGVGGVDRAIIGRGGLILRPRDFYLVIYLRRSRVPHFLIRARLLVQGGFRLRVSMYRARPPLSRDRLQGNIFQVYVGVRANTMCNCIRLLYICGRLPILVLHRVGRNLATRPRLSILRSRIHEV